MADTKKCERCEKVGTDFEKQAAGYFLCPPCKIKVVARLKTAAVQPKPSEATYVIDREELRALRSDGLLPIRTYVFLALKLQYPNGIQKINITGFCQYWGMQPHDFLSAISSLGKKGIVALETQDLEIQSLSREERIAKLEQALEEAKG